MRPPKKEGKVTRPRLTSPKRIRLLDVASYGTSSRRAVRRYMFAVRARRPRAVLFALVFLPIATTPVRDTGTLFRFRLHVYFSCTLTVNRPRGNPRGAYDEETIGKGTRVVSAFPRRSDPTLTPRRRANVFLSRTTRRFRFVRGHGRRTTSSAAGLGGRLTFPTRETASRPVRAVVVPARSVPVSINHAVVRIRERTRHDRLPLCARPAIDVTPCPLVPVPPRPGTVAPVLRTGNSRSVSGKTENTVTVGPQAAVAEIRRSPCVENTRVHFENPIFLFSQTRPRCRCFESLTSHAFFFLRRHV